MSSPRATISPELMKRFKESTDNICKQFEDVLGESVFELLKDETNPNKVIEMHAMLQPLIPAMNAFYQLKKISNGEAKAEKESTPEEVEQFILIQTSLANMLHTMVRSKVIYSVKKGHFISTGNDDFQKYMADFVNSAQGKKINITSITNENNNTNDSSDNSKEFQKVLKISEDILKQWKSLKVKVLTAVFAEEKPEGIKEVLPFMKEIEQLIAPFGELTKMTEGSARYFEKQLFEKIQFFFKYSTLISETLNTIINDKLATPYPCNNGKEVSVRNKYAVALEKGLESFKEKAKQMASSLEEKSTCTIS